MPTEKLLSSLPTPEPNAYFPDISLVNQDLQEEVLRRTGKDNLVYAIQYGSFVTGDTTPTSMIDLIIVVEDTRRFHQRNMDLHKDDYGPPLLVSWHNFLNKFSLNFYHTYLPHMGQSIKAKYAVISRQDFIRGCHGSLAEKEKEGQGAFGLYVAGRMQKVALRPLYKTENEEKVVQIEKAINAARIDGVWLSLGFLGDEFDFNELLTTYVYLSYRADLRVEKPGKIQTMIERNRKDYEVMLRSILNQFTQVGLIRPNGEERWQKVQFPSQEEVKRRMRELKVRSAITNYGKNVLTVGLFRGIRYAVEKVQRAIAK